MPDKQVQFSVSYDRTTKVLSTLVCALLFAIPIATQSYFAAVAAVLILVFAYAYSPRGYVVGEQAITVERLIGNVRFPLKGLREARRTTPDDLRGAIRLWGSGGMFGYYGLFRTSILGKCTWYVTDRRNMTVVITDAKTALFSPDDPSAFLAELAANPNKPDYQQSGEYAGLQPERRGPSAGAWIGMALGAAGLALAIAALLYAPGPPRYTLTTEELTIHDRFYPVTLKAAEVDAARLRIVDIARDPEWKPVSRTNGFANSHYRSGWFRVAGGTKVRMYRADGLRMVLLPPKGNQAPVLMEVNEPERFLEELRRKWANHS